MSIDLKAIAQAEDQVDPKADQVDPKADQVVVKVGQVVVKVDQVVVKVDQGWEVDLVAVDQEVLVVLVQAVTKAVVPVLPVVALA